MAQRRVSETLIGTTEAGEILDMGRTNVAKSLELDLHTVVFRAVDVAPELPSAIRAKLRNLEIEVKVDEKGRVRMQELLVGSVSQRGYSRDWVEEVKRLRQADAPARAIDAKRRASMRSKATVD